MSKEVLISRIKEMKCGTKPIPQKYIDCFNDYIEKVINTRVDQAIEGLQEINKSLGQTCNNDVKEIERLQMELLEKEKDIEYYESWFSSDENPLVESKKIAIDELEKVKDFIIKNNEPTRKMTEITRFINQQIRTLKGEK